MAKNNNNTILWVLGIGVIGFIGYQFLGNKQQSQSYTPNSQFGQDATSIIGSISGALTSISGLLSTGKQVFGTNTTNSTTTTLTAEQQQANLASGI